MTQNYFKVYKFLKENAGDKVVLKPDIPLYTAECEDRHTNRICVSTSIMGCMTSLFPTCLFDEDENIDINLLGKPFDIYLYSATVFADDNFKIPGVDEVPDVWYTNEMWLLEDTEFTLEGKYTIRKMMDIPNSCYSRFLATKEGYYEVADRYTAALVYGEPEAFSYIDTNPYRFSDAMAYGTNYEAHRIINQINKAKAEELKQKISNGESIYHNKPSDKKEDKNDK